MSKPSVIGGFGKIGSTGQYHQQSRVYDENCAISVTTAFNPYYKESEGEYYGRFKNTKTNSKRVW